MVNTDAGIESITSQIIEANKLTPRFFPDLSEYQTVFFKLNRNVDLLSRLIIFPLRTCRGSCTVT